VTTRTTRRVARAAGIALLAAPLTLATALPAAAQNEGEVPDPLPLLPSLLIFGGIPLLIILTIGLLVFGPGALRKPRYRPTEGWDHDPVWYGGPEDAESAVQQAEPKQPGRGGSSATW
jgi:hypothetical protein